MTDDPDWMPMPSLLKQIERLFRAYDTPFGLSSEAMYDKADGYVLAAKGFPIEAVKKAVDAFVTGSAPRKRGKRSTLPTSDEFGSQVRDEDKALKVRGPDGTKTHAPPFGPLWSAKVYQLLGLGPDDPMPLASKFIQSVIDAGGEKAEAYRLHHQSMAGFATVNTMFDLASSGKGWSVEVALEAMTMHLEPVPVSGEVFKDWRAIHADRGWPWFPWTGNQRVVYLPRDGDALHVLIGGDKAKPVKTPPVAPAEEPWPDELP